MNPLPGYVPAVDHNLWKGSLLKRIPAGTVLSGILEQDLSSAKSKPGDTFDIRLQDGVSINGNMLIPPQSKIVGVVKSVAPAAMMRHGHPGRLDVSLQSLVLIDGRHVPFVGFIDHNPNHLPREQPKRKMPGQSFSDYGNTLNAFAGQWFAGVGSVMKKRHQGLDFQLDKGEIVPVRLNRSLELPQDGAPQTARSGYHGVPINAPPGGWPFTGQPQGTPIGNANQPYGHGIPGLAGPDPDAPMVPPAVPGQSATPIQSADPNAIFTQPIQSRPLADMPEPF